MTGHFIWWGQHLTSRRVFWCSSAYMQFSELFCHGCWHLLERWKSGLRVSTGELTHLRDAGWEGHPVVLGGFVWLQGAALSAVCKLTLSSISSTKLLLQIITLVTPKLCPPPGRARNLSNTAWACGLQVQCFILIQVAFHLSEDGALTTGTCNLLVSQVFMFYG